MRILLFICLINATVYTVAQPSYNYNDPFVCTSQLGFRPGSPKELSLLGGQNAGKLPDQIPFFIQKAGDRLPRKLSVPAAWGENVFRWPFDLCWKGRSPTLLKTTNHSMKNLSTEASLQNRIHAGVLFGEQISQNLTSISPETIKSLAEKLMARQEINKSGGLSGYFMEANNQDGYRSVAFPVEPAMALLRLCEINPVGLGKTVGEAKEAIHEFVESYLIADAASNPFSLPPYGIYTKPQFSKDQIYRKANEDRYVRTFIHVFHENPIPHGTGGTLLQQGYFMARAGSFFDNPNWKGHAERILQWSTGHNTAGLCLFYGVGFKHPVPGNFVNYNIPDGVSIGFLGRPDDTPYLETDQAIEWSTQEVWDVPFYYTIGLISYLK